MTGNSRPRVSFVPENDGGEIPLVSGSRTFTLYRATPETGTYAHHGHVAYFRNALYAAWSNHAQDEDAPGQHVQIRRSADLGETWTDPVVLFPPLDDVAPASEDGPGRRKQCSNGFAVVDGVLYAFSEVWDKTGEKQRDGLGRLARAISAEGTLGSPFWLRAAPPPARTTGPAYPAGDPSLVQKIDAHLGRPGNELTWDFRHLTTRPRADDGHQLCEPTRAWRLPDGTWCRMYRDLGGSRCNYASFSHDDGATWTAPTRTDFPDACSRATSGMLPDGQVYVISNISRQQRDPLAISLARDGMRFDRVALIRSGVPPRRYEGRYKDIGFQYPHAGVAGDSLRVIYSVNKEDVEITSIPLTDLGM